MFHGTVTLTSVTCITGDISLTYSRVMMVLSGWCGGEGGDEVVVRAVTGWW